jgi:cytochrome c551/c552
MVLRLVGSLIILVLVSAFLSSCIGIEETVEAPVPLIPPDATGEQLYNMPVLGTQVGCVTCHSLDDTTVLGPSLQDIGSAAQERIPGMSAAEYIRQSILEPNAFIIEGSTPNLMPPNYTDALTEAQIDALVTFLMSQ